ncbi:MAG: fused MFS/spermidine synthase [Limisphaerales bacterium]
MLVYAVTIFTGAFLLFQVQPLIGKYILPWFGGGPGVWTTCMLFFQVLLLGGYAYAHFTSRWLRPRRQAIVHLVLLAAALALLPITPNDNWKPQGASNPTLQILALLAVSIGLPYFVLSATGPLVQQWFNRSKPGVSPYRLYALSNVGSLLALVSYPFFFETHFTRHTQAGLWAWGLAAYAVACGFCAVRVWKAEGQNPKLEIRSPKEIRIPKSEFPAQSPTPSIHQSTNPSIQHSSTPALQHSSTPSAPAINSQPPTIDRLLWLLLPACASVLLLATTNKICQDVAVIPFLWVLPLALYLLSFIICFDSPRWYKRLPFGLALGVALAGICWVLFQQNQAIDGFVAALFVCCMVCHGELYRLKPDPRHLTGYYLTIAAGGALGGLFVAVIAPLIFTDYFELHWGLLLCGVLFLVVCLKSLRPESPPGSGAGVSPAEPGVSSAAESSRAGRPDGRRDARPTIRPSPVTKWLWVGCGLWAIGVVALGVGLWTQAHKFGGSRLSRVRNFYGVLTVFKYNNSDVRFLKLMHGNIEHGLQFLDPVRAAWPTAYYNEGSGVGLAMTALAAGSRRIGLVGLGAGTLAAYGQAGDYLRFYEINPDVLRLARSPFTYLAHCKGKVDVVLGDARLSLEREPAQNFDLLVLDAFNSDAIPVHLLTAEAFAVYERHIKTNGIIAFHISNGHLNLEPVVLNLARRFNYESAIIEFHGTREQWWNPDSTWVLLSRSDEIINSPAIRESTRPAQADSGQVQLWTDDFASLFQIIRWGAAPAVEPRPAEAEVEVAAKLSGRGDFAGAIARYRRALEIDPYLAEALNNLAWLLATCPEASLRNGPEAAQLAERACEITEYHRTIFVGTLGAAYAEAGRFPDAVATAQKACELASIFKEEPLLAKNRELLEFYRAGKPYHEPERTTDGPK